MLCLGGAPRLSFPSVGAPNTISQMDTELMMTVTGAIVLTHFLAMAPVLVLGVIRKIVKSSVGT